MLLMNFVVFQCIYNFPWGREFYLSPTNLLCAMFSKVTQSGWLSSPNKARSLLSWQRLLSLRITWMSKWLWIARQWLLGWLNTSNSQRRVLSWFKSLSQGLQNCKMFPGYLSWWIPCSGTRRWLLSWFQSLCSQVWRWLSSTWFCPLVLGWLCTT